MPDFSIMQRGTQLWLVKGQRFSGVKFCELDRIPGHFSVKVLMTKRTKRIADGLNLVDDAEKLKLQREFFTAKHAYLLTAVKNNGTADDPVPDLASRFKLPRMVIKRLILRAQQLGLLEVK